MITHTTDDGMGAGTVYTQRMLESLGRAETIPGVTQLRRIERVKENAPPRPRPQTGYWEAMGIVYQIGKGAIHRFEQGEIMPTENIQRRHKRFLLPDRITVGERHVRWVFPDICWSGC